MAAMQYGMHPGQAYVYFNRKITFSGLPYTDRQRYVDKLKSSGIDK